MALRMSFKRAFISQFGFLLRDWTTGMLTGITVLLISLVAGWFPDGLAAIIFDSDLSRGIWMVITSVVIIAGFITLGIKHFSDIEFDVDEKLPARKKALIVFLSNVRMTNKELEKALENFLEETRGKELSEVKALLNKSPMSNWRMALEALEYHLPELKKLIVIASEDSFSQIECFKRLLAGVLKDSFRSFEIEKLKVKDFDNVEKVFNTLKEAYENLYSCGLKDRDIIVDVTGGRKPISIAGALMTVAYPYREFQYVSADKDFKNYVVKSYDVRLISGDNV